jgi:hypothetical protein
MANTPTTNPTRFEEGTRSKVHETTVNFGDKAKSVAETAKDAAQSATDKAKEAAQTVTDKAKDAASTIGHKAEDATHAVGSGMESLAGTLRDKLPQKGPLHAAAAPVVEGLQSSGKYLQEEGLKGMAEDVTTMIRRNPVPAVLVGIAFGFLLARITTRS